MNSNNAVDPFACPKIHAQLYAELARIEATWQQWLAEPEGSYADRLVQHLVDAYDAHARMYLEAVQAPDRISLYLRILRVVGIKLFQNAETRGPLRPCYDDDHLRQIAVSSFDFILEQHKGMSAEEQEVYLQNAVAKLRMVCRKEAEESLVIRLDLVHRIETRFEAQYQHWKAEAISRILLPESPHAPSAPVGAVGSAERLAEKNSEPQITGRVTSSRIGAVDSRGAGRHKRYPQSDLQPTRWQDIKITCISEKRLHIRVGDKAESCGYAELGLDDRRTGNPNQTWQTLLRLAESGGSIRTAEGVGTKWSKVEKGIQSLRKFLRYYFPVPDDPLPLYDRGRGYQALFCIDRHRAFNT